MDTELQVAVAGLGAVGMAVAERLDAGLPGLALVAASARNLDAAARRVAGFRRPPRICPVDGLALQADVVVECAPAAAFREIAEPVLQAGKTLIPASVGAILAHQDLVELARRAGARMVIPSGALLGLDGVRAAAQGKIHQVRIETRKPPRSLAGAPLVVEQGIDLEALREPLRLFSGSAREAIRHFPANVNVAVALSLAGLGPDHTEVEIWADPGVERNTHRISVEADSARMQMLIENVPSETNPGSGKLTALSLISTLRNLVEPLAF